MLAGLRPLRVVALTSGRDVPSARFRVRQHIPLLRELGLDVEEHPAPVDKYLAVGVTGRMPGPVAPGVSWLLRKAVAAGRRSGVAASASADLTWLERELVPGRYSLEGMLGRPVVFDVDDSIWAHRDARPSEIRRIAEESALVIAGNDYIADWFRAHARRVEVIPTAVDARRFVPRKARPADEPFRVGWIGTSSNFDALRAIEQPLGSFLDSRDAVLTVVADKPPHLDSIASRRVEFQRWSAAREVEAVRRFDVGLMPVLDDEWGRGKCGYKALQYMACAIPAVVSPVGFNRKLVATGGAVAAGAGEEWAAVLDELFSDPEHRLTVGRAGRAAVEREFSCEVVSRTIARVLRSAVEGHGHSPATGGRA